jgi:hypothetical protein
MTTYDLKQTGQLIEAMRRTRLFALTLLAGMQEDATAWVDAGLKAAKRPSSGSNAVSKRPLEVLLSY